MRFWLQLLLALSMIMPPSLGALASSGRVKPARAYRAVQTYVQSNHRYVLSMPKIDSKQLKNQLYTAAADKPKEAAAGVGQTLLLIMALTTVDLARQEIENRKRNRNFQQSDVKSIVGHAVTATLNNPAIWGGIAGAGVLGIAERPALLLTKLLTQPKFLQAFRPILTRMTLSLVTFVGWEFGSQLWNEAALRLEDSADVQRAQSMSGLTSGFLNISLYRATQNDRENVRVAKRMMSEVTYVLLHQSTLRQWFDNTLRLRVMTGEFSTLLTSMVTAGAVGTMIFPGAGTLAGAMFGLVGGVAALFLPQGFKDSITDKFQSARKGALSFSMSSNSQLVADAMIPVRIFGSAVTPEQQTLQIRKALFERRKLRDRLANVAWEKLRRSLQRVNAQAITAQQFESNWADAYAGLVAVYSNDTKELARLALIQIDSPRVPRILGRYVEREIARTELMTEILISIKTTGRGAITNDAILKLVEISVTKGSSEENLLKTFEATPE